MKNSTQKVIQRLSLALVISFLTLNSQAQKMVIGARFMPTYSALNLKTSSGNSVKGDATFGYGVGGLLGYNFKKMIGVQAEVLYSSITQKYKEADVERNIQLKYINIPLLLSLNTGIKGSINLNVVAGPQIGLSMGSDVVTTGADGSSSKAVVSVKKGDLGFAYGAGVDFGLNEKKTIRLCLGYRGVMGLIDISDNSQTVATNSYYIIDKTHIKTNAVYLGFSLLF